MNLPPILYIGDNKSQSKIYKIVDTSDDFYVNSVDAQDRVDAGAFKNNRHITVQMDSLWHTFLLKYTLVLIHKIIQVKWIIIYFYFTFLSL